MVNKSQFYVYFEKFEFTHQQTTHYALGLFSFKGIFLRKKDKKATKNKTSLDLLLTALLHIKRFNILDLVLAHFTIRLSTALSIIF